MVRAMAYVTPKVWMHVPMEPELAETIDAWRRVRGIDARTKAVRRLIDIALKHEPPPTREQLDSWYFETCSDE